MSLSNIPKYQLRISPVESTLQVSVIDNDDRICARSFGEAISVELKRGIYTVRSERDGRIADKLVRLVKDTHVSPEELLQFSPVPLGYSATSHEYYSYAAWETSQHHTAPDIAWNGTAAASMMLFVRAFEASENTITDQVSGLALKTLDGPLTDFPISDCNFDDTVGMAAWSAKMSPGFVILETEADEPRQVPIRLVEGFQTQVYIMYRERPMFEDMRVLTVPYEDLGDRGMRDPYTRDDEYAQTYEYIDAGLVALNNQGSRIADRLIDKFLQSKFRNPLLGLIGAYLLVMRMQSAESSDDRSNLLKIVIRNLGELLPGSSDISALKVLAEPWLEEADLQPIYDVPLFRIGTDALIAKAATRPELIPKGSLLDVVSEHLIDDSVWTAWEPVPLPIPADWRQPRGDEMSWVELAIADSVADTTETLSTSKLAQHIGVTIGAVRDAYASLVKRTASEPTSVAVENFDMDRVRLGLINRTSDELNESLRPELMELAKGTRVSYQKVYPGLKNVISSLEKPASRVRASDSIDSVVAKWSEPAIQKELLQKLERRFVINLDDVETRVRNVSTVRDLASLVLKQTKLP